MGFSTVPPSVMVCCSTAVPPLVRNDTVNVVTGSSVFSQPAVRVMSPVTGVVKSYGVPSSSQPVNS